MILKDDRFIFYLKISVLHAVAMTITIQLLPFSIAMRPNNFQFPKRAERVVFHLLESETIWKITACVVELNSIVVRIIIFSCEGNHNEVTG